MSNVLLMAPLTIPAVVPTLGPAASQTGAATVQFLLTPDPRETWSMSGGGIIYLDIDFGANVTFDTVLLGYGSANMLNSNFTLSAGTSSSTDTSYGNFIRAKSTFTDPDFIHILATLAAPITARYVRVAVNSATAQTITWGLLAIGLRFTPSYNFEYGAGRVVTDTGTATRLLGGSFAIDPGSQVGGFQLTLGDLTDAEVETLYRLARRRGMTNSLLLVEDPDNTNGLAERIHWGLLSKLDAYERFAPGATRWSLRIDDWA